MKRLVLLSLLAVAIYKVLTAPRTSIDIPPPRAASVVGEQVTQHELMSLFDAGIGFADLAEPGHYTVIERYLDSCGVCRELESGFQEFTVARPDVRLLRVRAPEGGINITTNSDEETESALSRLRNLGDGCGGVPYIEIYGPDGRLMISDRCERGGDVYALKALRAWMAAEQNTGT